MIAVYYILRCNPFFFGTDGDGHSVFVGAADFVMNAFKMCKDNGFLLNLQKEPYILRVRNISSLEEQGYGNIKRLSSCHYVYKLYICAIVVLY